jgi:hypothetical protein
MHIRSQFSPIFAFFQYQATPWVFLSSGEAPALIFEHAVSIFRNSEHVSEINFLYLSFFSVVFLLAGKLWNEWTDRCLANRINWLNFVIETMNVYSDVRTGFLNIPYTKFVLESVRTCIKFLGISLCGFVLLGNLLWTCVLGAQWMQ